MTAMDKMDKPTDAPWPIEEVYPRDLVLGDVVKIADNMPWSQITRIVDAGDDQPEWEKPLGKRGFELSPIDGKGLATITCDNQNVRTAWRRVQDQ